MRYLYILIFLSFSFINAQNFETEFEKSEGTKTATYKQTIEFYKNLANTYPQISILEIGTTDSGLPMHIVIFNTDGKTKLEAIKESNKATILINNGIHPGEPDGIDASMMLLRDIAQEKSLQEKYKEILICVIPVYNIGGSLNRNSTSRVNQKGPESYGFRGNARNFDLNRDFIKNDTKNAQTFAKIYHLTDPDIFIENHVSNGADYQYVLTHLYTQHNKLGGELGKFLNDTMIPEIDKDLLSKNLRTTPYVNVFNRVPENGFSQFFDFPRYSSGYTTLFHTLGLVVETHMLKPYKQRVLATYEIMVSTLNFLDKHKEPINKQRKKDIEDLLTGTTYPIQWEIDSTKTSTLQFRGYEGTYIKSEVTGLDRLKYDRSRPFTKPVKYYNNFKPKKEIEIPVAYIIPQGWHEVIKRLDLNRIKYLKLETDTVIQVESYKIKDFETIKNVYEGHYLHFNTSVSKRMNKVNFRKGDLYIPTQQKGIRYLIETLEPEAPDSFFNWNFFDTVLQQKEGFSPYVFEDLAIDILRNNPGLKTSFEQKKKSDKNFSENWYAQLKYIYQHSKYAEKAYLQYPVYRVVKN